MIQRNKDPKVWLSFLIIEGARYLACSFFLFKTTAFAKFSKKADTCVYFMWNYYPLYRVLHVLHCFVLVTQQTERWKSISRSWIFTKLNYKYIQIIFDEWSISIPSFPLPLAGIYDKIALINVFDLLALSST